MAQNLLFHDVIGSFPGEDLFLQKSIFESLPLVQWFSNFCAMERFYIIGNITKPLFKIIHITINNETLI